MTNQTVTLDAKVVDQVIDALDAGYTPGLKDALKVLRAAKADSRTGETTMTTLQEALPCPFCGKQHTLQLISGQELMGEDQEFWQHSESFGVVCDASTPDGKGGCGAMGGFKPTEDEAIEAWNTRTALAQQELPQKERPDFMAGYDAGMADAKRMAQQGEPVAGLNRSYTEQLINALHENSDPVSIDAAEEFQRLLAAALAQQMEQQPVCRGCGIPAGDVHMSTCKSGKWPSRVSNGDTAAPAPQPAQGVGRTNPGDETGGAGA